MPRDKSQVIRTYYLAMNFLLIFEAGIIKFLMIPRLVFLSKIEALNKFCDVAFIIGIVMLIGYIAVWCISHHINRGMKYAVYHARLMRKVRKSLKNAGYYMEEYFRGERVAVLPKIKIEMDDSLLTGKVIIENHIKLDKKLEDVNISSALGKYIVKQQYISKNANYYVYEFEDASVDTQLVFDSYKDFCMYAKKVGDYTLFTDAKTKVPLTHLLLVGATGSGKTYSLYTLILTMLNWSVKPNLFFADPKNSSLVVLGNRIDSQNTAGTIEEIIALLERFHEQMQERKTEIKERLNEKLDADYRYWNLPANVLIIDEYSGFQSAVNIMDKKTRDRISMLIRDIVLQGRQLGFFLWIVMQKSDASDLSTNTRSNLLWKVVLGNATRTTYQTAFEESANLPVRNFKQGQGLYSYQGITREPETTSFPTLHFDILNSISL